MSKDSINEFAGHERRREYRKEYNVPIKLIPKERVSLIGDVLNVSCYGLKVGIGFRNTGPKPMLDAIFAAPNIMLEFADNGGVNFKLLANTKWKAFKNGHGERIYEIGLALNLNEEQKKDWHKFYDLLKD